MKLTLHIGMGKTGSSAIQKVLRDNQVAFSAAGVHNLGMWMDPYGKLQGRPSHAEYFRKPEAVWRKRANDLVKEVQDTPEAEKELVNSNESFFHFPHEMAAFMDEFSKSGTVRAIAYVRDPYTWLPSAYAQWGISHKVRPGPVPTFADYARTNIRQYESLLEWQKLVPDFLTIRKYDDIDDVTADFLEFVGAPKLEEAQRFYKRRDDAQLVLRALFNNRFKNAVRPEVFDKVVLKSLPDNVTAVSALLKDNFSYSEIGDIIGENASLFDEFKAETGVDLVSATPQTPRDMDAREVQDRIIDYLIELAISQSLTIEALSDRMDAVEASLTALQP